MTFRLVQAQYDRKTLRAYVELRDLDDDGGEVIAAAIFSFRSKTILSEPELKQDLYRKARHIMRRAAV